MEPDLTLGGGVVEVLFNDHDTRSASRVRLHHHDLVLLGWRPGYAPIVSGFKE